jgi:hypothetical protein
VLRHAAPILLALALGRTSAGCSCAGQSSAEGSLAGATAVFLGKAGSRSAVGPIDYAYKFKVLSAWKGVDSPTVVVNTPRESTMCGVPFERGRVYLVYAYGGPRQLGTDDCTRTDRAELLADDLAVLGDPAYVGPLITRTEALKIAIFLVVVGWVATRAVSLVRRLVSRYRARPQMA